MIKSSYLLALAPLMWGPAFASEAPSLPLDVDPNQDGMISREEFVSMRNTIAFQGDADSDGRLSKEEFTPMIPSRVPSFMHGRAFSQFDTNRDGFVDSAELDTGPARAFDQADANGDNAISGDEIAEFRTTLEESGFRQE